MGKKIVRNKTAQFILEPDGFSIHTFELSREVKPKEYFAIKDHLYRRQKESAKSGWMFKDEYGNHYCTLYKKHGIHTIKLEHNENEQVDTYFVRMVVNPRKLLDPASSYLGILPPEESSVRKLRKAFAKQFKGTVFENDINVYQITRADLCTNIRCENKKLFRELVRVLRKLPKPPKYDRVYYKHKDKKAANRYNKHYLRFRCGTHELVIYDKTYHMQENNLVVSYEDQRDGVLRFEVRCERDYIRKFEQKFDCTKTEDVLWRLIQESESHIIKHFSWCFSDARFVQMEEIERLIKKSAYTNKNKAIMLELASQLQRMQSVDKAKEKFEKKGYNTDDLLERFDKLGISPIPLRKNFCAESLPGPVELLKYISDGAIPIDYIEVKHK